MNKAIVALILFAAQAVIHLRTRATELPVETFFKALEWDRMKVSPDGKNLAGFAIVNRQRHFVMFDLETKVPKSLMHGSISDFVWVSNDRLILETGGIGLGGLLAINKDGTNEKILVPPLVFQMTHPNFRFHVAEILSVLDREKGEVLIESAEINPYIRPEIPRTEVQRMNVVTGRSQLEAKHGGRVIHWLSDHDGEVRAAVAIDKDRLSLLYRRDKTADWETLYEFNLQGDGVWPVEFTPDNTDLYVRANNGKDTDGIYRFEVQRRVLGECLWQNDRFDCGQLITVGNRPSGVYFYGEKPQIDWLDAGWKTRQSEIDKLLPNTFNHIVSTSRDGTKVLCLASNDRTPGTYYLFDKGSGALNVAFSRAPWIKPEQMAPMKPIQYKGRDGLMIHGYLTMPLESEGKHLPLIVYPHGGPWLRDTWGFYSDVQFFANRGYAVLQMNFRGSTGYGSAFERAGFKQWGLAMQDDITDGIRWAVKEGIADSSRICIYGSSYGGFAALMGLIKTPELYKCGINYAGVTDVESLLRYQSVHRPEQFRTVQRFEVGDFAKEKKELEEISPINHVDKIKVPLLLVYGGKDPIVRIEQGNKLAKELKKHGKQFELIIEQDEGHGFRSETNVFKLYRKIDEFLKENL